MQSSPSHIHGFYLSCTYYHRKGKVRKGRYPGGPKAGIFDQRVWRGGASRERVEELRGEEEEGRGGRGKKKAGQRRRRRRVDDGYGGDARVGEGCWDQEGRRERGDGRSEMSEGLDGRRTILGEVSGRY